MASTQHLEAVVEVKGEVVETSPNAVRIRETITTADDQPLTVRGSGTLVFDPVSGHVARYSCQQTVAENGTNKPRGMVVEIECVRVTADEQQAWEAQKAAERAAQKRETERPFTEDESATLVEELAQGKNVSLWLHRIDRKPVENLTAEVIDAVIPFLENEKYGYNITAQRIIDRVPDDRLNPFHELPQEADETSE